MWADWKNSPYRHFYIKELTQMQDGQFVIPMKWVVFEAIDHCEAYRVTLETQVSPGVAHVRMCFDSNFLPDRYLRYP